MTKIGIAISMICAMLAMQAMAADWPQFRGPNADGIAPDTGINKDWTQKPPKVLWKVALGDNGYAGPSVVQGKLFTIDHAGSQDIVRAIDLNTGQEAWRYAYEETDKDNYGFSRSTPVFSEGKLYTLSRMGTLNCLDASNGKKLWSKRMIEDFGGMRPPWDYAWSPVVDGNKLIIAPGGDKSVVALDKNTGETIWAGGASGLAGYSTPVVATILGQKQYVVFLGKLITGVNADDGKLLWQLPWKTSYDVNAATPIVIGNSVLAASGYEVGAGLIEITPQGPKELWHSKDLVAQFNSPVYYNKFIFGTGDPGNLACIDPQSGQAVWKQPGFEKGGVVAVDGAIIAVDGRAGDVVMANATNAGYQELGRIKPLGGQSWTAPIVADGKLIIRNKQAIVCLDLM